MLRSAIKNFLFTISRPTSTLGRASLRPLLARGYHENVISHYEKPRNVCRYFYVYTRIPLSDNIHQVGSLPKHDIDVGTGLVGAPA